MAKVRNALRKANEWIDNLSIGLGHGITNQLEGTYQMAAHPVQFANALMQMGRGAINDPRGAASAAGNALMQTAQRGLSGPLGFGEVLGENLSPGMFRGGPARNELITYHSSPHRINNVPQPPAKSHAISHRPMSDAGGAARLHDLSPAFGEDIYGKNALQYFGSGDPREAAVLPILRQVRGNPSADVTIYRGVPQGAGDNIDVGDWVTLDKSVAQQYAGEGGKVLAKKVKAIDVTAWPDSLHEYGYFPDPYGKFDLSKVGTGEGAQAYGHGIYLSEDAVMNRNHYYKKFAHDPRASESAWLNGEELAPLAADWRQVDPSSFAARALDGVPAGLSADGRAQYAIRALRKQYPDAPLEFEDAVDEAARTVAANAVERRKGHFYTVDLPDEHIANMLDWDAPLSEQAIKEAITPENMGLTLKELPSGYMGFVDDTGKPVGTFQKGGTPESFRSRWIENAQKQTGQGVYSWLSTDKQQASKLLGRAGIPGIKYFDGGSRAAGEGTRNFVIFDGDYAKILKRE